MMPAAVVLVPAELEVKFLVRRRYAEGYEESIFVNFDWGVTKTVVARGNDLLSEERWTSERTGYKRFKSWSKLREAMVRATN